MSGDALLIWGLALLGIALVMLVMEVFVPSGGVIAVIAAICAMGGIGMLWKYDTMWGVTGLLTVLVLGPIVMAWGFKMLPHTPVGRAILGGRSEEDLEAMRRDEEDRINRLRALVGAEGVALTAMRPVGDIEIDGEAMVGYAEHDWIEAGDRVIVTSTGGLEIEVRRV